MPLSYAAPILYRVQQKKMMEQHQKIIIQQEIEAHRHAGIIIDEEQRPPTYQEMVDRRNQAIAQAILNAHQSSADQVVAVAKPSPPTLFQRIMAVFQYLYALLKHFIDRIIGLIFNKVPEDQSQQQTASSGAVQPPPVEPRGPQAQQPAFSSEEAPQVTPAPTGNPQETQEVVDLSQVWKKLDKKSAIWTALDDDQAKLATVSEYISRFQKEGVKISQPPAHYVQMIDQISGDNPQMLQRPFGELLQIMAIVEYDFDNGMDRDALAKQVLGDAGYEANKKRFAQPQQPQGQQQLR